MNEVPTRNSVERDIKGKCIKQKSGPKMDLAHLEATLNIVKPCDRPASLGRCPYHASTVI